LPSRSVLLFYYNYTSSDGRLWRLLSCHYCRSGIFSNFLGNGRLTGESYHNVSQRRRAISKLNVTFSSCSSLFAPIPTSRVLVFVEQGESLACAQTSPYNNSEMVPSHAMRLDGSAVATRLVFLFSSFLFFFSSTAAVLLPALLHPKLLVPFEIRRVWSKASDSFFPSFAVVDFLLSSARDPWCRFRRSTGVVSDIASQLPALRTSPQPTIFCISFVSLSPTRRVLAVAFHFLFRSRLFLSFSPRQ